MRTLPKMFLGTIIGVAPVVVTIPGIFFFWTDSRIHFSTLPELSPSQLNPLWGSQHYGVSRFIPPVAAGGLHTITGRGGSLINLPDEVRQTTVQGLEDRSNRVQQFSRNEFHYGGSHRRF
jgi:hypothetical protein